MSNEEKGYFHKWRKRDVEKVERDLGLSKEPAPRKSNRGPSGVDGGWYMQKIIRALGGGRTGIKDLND